MNAPIPIGIGLLALLICAATGFAQAESRPWVATGRRMMVAADSPYASQAGFEVLRTGGNAVDAAAAVSFALAVTRPESTGLGGGGFMIVRFARDGRVVCLDYREMAPAAASPKMYVLRDGERPPPSSCFGYAAAAVPGVVAGHAHAVARYGTRPLVQSIQPAIRLAEGGFTADANYIGAARGALRDYREHPDLVDSCGYVYKLHLRSGELPKVGDTIVQPNLARLLRAIAERGPEVFYKGEVAEAIERQMKARGGLITRADLAAYQVKERQPLRTGYRGFELILMPPPSSGGVCIAETLNVLERFDLPAIYRSDPDLVAHYLVEAMKHAFADRARWLGDPDFATVPTARLTSDEHARRFAETIKPDAVAALDAYGLAKLPDDAGTSHFSIVDAEGNCAVVTETINTEFGSFAAIDEWGLILNNEMDDFTARPGEANAFGLLQSDRNAPAPGKRPLSSMSPTIVLRDGRPVLLIGGSGGPRIISAVLNVLVHHLDGGRPLPDALEATRIHHQWRPNEVVFDRPAGESLVQRLRSIGHEVSERRKGAAVQAIAITQDGIVGVSDPRKGGRPAGE